MATTQAKKWKGLSDGVTSEWTLVAKVKPGQEQPLRAYVDARLKEARETGYEKDIVIPVGTVHDYRWVLLDRGTMIFMSNFDGDWGAYIDDFFATGIVGESFDSILSHCEGYPGRSAPVSAKKDYMQAHTLEALTYTRAYRGTVKEMWKALAVQKAFQEVLEHPDAAKALEHPALKPLLAHAAK